MEVEQLNSDFSIQAYFNAIPKIDLHLHLEGSLTPGLLFKLAERNQLKLPITCDTDFFSLCNYDSFKQFADILLMGVYCLRKPQDFFDAVTSLGSHLEDENIRYAEVTWTPQFYLNRGFHLNDILDAMNSARLQLEKKTGIKIRWIPDLVRSYPKPSSYVASWAASDYAKEGGVVALGLGGPEMGNPANNFKSIFDNCDLPANPHAGEGSGPESVWQTLESLSPNRIGHGVRSIEDEELVAHLVDKKIPLEICITSNVRLGIYQSYQNHPVKKLIDAGCLVTLNTDDPVLFQTSLSREYLLAYELCKLSFLDILRTIHNSINSCYLSQDDKEKVKKEFNGELVKLDKTFGLNCDSSPSLIFS